MPKIVIVTGAGCGIGARSAALLARANEVVVVCEPEQNIVEAEQDVFLYRPREEIVQEAYFKDTHKRKFRGKQKRKW